MTDAKTDEDAALNHDIPRRMSETKVGEEYRDALERGLAALIENEALKKLNKELEQENKELRELADFWEGKASRRAEELDRLRAKLTVRLA